MAAALFDTVGKIDWVATIKLAFARGVASTLVLAGLFIAGYTTIFGRALDLLWWPFASVLVVAICYFMIKAVGYVMCHFMGGLADLITWALLTLVSLLIACGDPIVYLVNRFIPALLSVSDFKVVNFVPVILVQR